MATWMAAWSSCRPVADRDPNHGSGVTLKSCESESVAEGVPEGTLQQAVQVLAQMAWVVAGGRGMA